MKDAWVHESAESSSRHSWHPHSVTGLFVSLTLLGLFTGAFGPQVRKCVTTTKLPVTIEDLPVLCCVYGAEPDRYRAIDDCPTSRAQKFQHQERVVSNLLGILGVFSASGTQYAHDTASPCRVEGSARRVRSVPVVFGIHPVSGNFRCTDAAQGEKICKVRRENVHCEVREYAL